MGVMFIVAGVALTGLVFELVASATGNGNVGDYDYHFASGVGAVFGTRG